MTLPQLQHFLAVARAFSILEAAPAWGYWIRVEPRLVREAFDVGLAPFSALERPIAGTGDQTYVIPRGTPFVLLDPSESPRGRILP